MSLQFCSNPSLSALEAIGGRPELSALRGDPIYRLTATLAGHLRFLPLCHFFPSFFHTSIGRCRLLISRSWNSIFQPSVWKRRRCHSVFVTGSLMELLFRWRQIPLGRPEWRKNISNSRALRQFLSVSPPLKAFFCFPPRSATRLHNSVATSAAGLKSDGQNWFSFSSVTLLNLNVLLLHVHLKAFWTPMLATALAGGS